MEKKDIAPLQTISGMPALLNNHLMPLPTGNFVTDLLGGWKQGVVNKRLERTVEAARLFAELMVIPFELQTKQAELQHNNNMFVLQEAEQFQKNKALEMEAKMLELQVQLQSYQNRQQMDESEEPEDLLNGLQEMFTRLQERLKK